MGYPIPQPSHIPAPPFERRIVLEPVPHSLDGGVEVEEIGCEGAPVLLEVALHAPGSRMARDAFDVRHGQMETIAWL